MAGPRHGRQEPVPLGRPVGSRLRGRSQHPRLAQLREAGTGQPLPCVQLHTSQGHGLSLSPGSLLHQGTGSQETQPPPSAPRLGTTAPAHTGPQNSSATFQNRGEADAAVPAGPLAGSDPSAVGSTGCEGLRSPDGAPAGHAAHAPHPSTPRKGGDRTVRGGPASRPATAASCPCPSLARDGCRAEPSGPLGTLALVGKGTVSRQST